MPRLRLGVVGRVEWRDGGLLWNCDVWSGIYGVERCTIISFTGRIGKLRYFRTGRSRFGVADREFAILKHILEMRRRSRTYPSYD